MLNSILLCATALAVGRTEETPNRFPVDVNNAIAVEIIAAGFNLPQALGIVIARETTGPFTGWKDLKQELRRHGLLDCGPYCLRAIEKARPFVVFSGPTRMPVGAGVELVKRAREEWNERGPQLGSASKSVSEWLYDNRRFLGRVNVNDASVADLLVAGFSIVDAELVRALVATSTHRFKNFGELEQRIQELEKTAPCGRFCRVAFEQIRSSKLVVWGQMTTIVHPDPARELREATLKLRRELKKMPTAARAALEALRRFARIHGLALPSLGEIDAPSESVSPKDSDAPDRATLKR